MKQTLYFKYLVVVLLLTTLVACKEDPKEPNLVKNVGYLKIDNNRINLSQAYLEDYGTHASDTYNIDLTILSDQTRLPSEDLKYAVVYFEMFSSMPKDLAIGEYSINEFMDCTALNYSASSESIIGTKLSFNEESQSYEIKNGTVIRPTSGHVRITQADSDGYEIKYLGYGDAITYKEGIDPSYKSGVAIQIHYKGNVKYFKGETITYSKSSKKVKLRRNFLCCTN
ncbi:MAG: hypothetical protein ACK5L5_08120 [Bacteroidales bacterium]